MGNGDGPSNAHLMIVGEAWGRYEEEKQRPFVGPSGDELNRMMQEAGLHRSQAFCTNVVNAMPPYGMIDRWVTKKRKDMTPTMRKCRDWMAEPIVFEGIRAMLNEINLVRPNVIVALGNTALWALTGHTGILKWRGSQLHTDIPFELWTDGMREEGKRLHIKVIPTIHSAAVLREWTYRQTVVHDLKRAARELETSDYTNLPEWNFRVAPSEAEVFRTLEMLLEGLAAGRLEWIDFDLETKAGHIDCAGLSWSKTDAICIPFMCKADRTGYWLPEVEAHIVWLLYRVLTHPKVKVRGQNLLYDAQYTYRHWHFVPKVAQDTMISHHTAFCGLRKSLDFQASLYCDYYKQWKPDKAAWKEGG